MVIVTSNMSSADVQRACRYTAAKRRAAQTAPGKRATKNTGTMAHTTAQQTRQRAINAHPYASKSPGFAQVLIDNPQATLGQALQALDEANTRNQGKSVGSSDSTKSAFQLQQERLDSQHGTIKQAQARSEGEPSQTQLQSTKSAFQQHQERLDRSHGAIDVGVGP